jgi:hypothetical protein
LSRAAGAALCAVLLAAPAAAAPDDASLAAGRRIYREGILPSGDPVPAVVQGDLAVDGRAFPCASCHLRSGRGALEGRLAVRALTGPVLFRPLRQEAADTGSAARRRAPLRALPPLRPAYDRASLGRAIRQGLDPAGRVLDAAMPRYRLSDEDMSSLVRYLSSLGSEPIPGVTGSSLRFATIVAADADPAAARVMWEALEAVVRDHNAQVRRPVDRARQSTAGMGAMYAGYRRIELVRWQLEGEPSTWRDQLAAHERAAPVFGILAGMAADWRPIHDFCEEREIPSLLPVADPPEREGRGWYTLYLSRGLAEEAETAARYFHGLASAAPVVQAYRAGGRGASLARRFREKWSSLDRPALEDRLLDGADARAFLRGLAGEWPGAVFALWLEGEDLEGLEALDAARPAAVVLSSTLAGERLPVPSDALRERMHLTWPRALPADHDRRMAFVRRWYEAKGLAFTHPDVQSRLYVLAALLSRALKHVRADLSRDWLLDVIDMMNDETFALSPFPRLTFGPGQRVAAKGCYVVGLGPGPAPAIVPRSEWIVP